MGTEREFGTLIQNVRKQKGLEVRTLAEQVGVDASTISRIENLHTEATVYTAFRICKGLEISLPDLALAFGGRPLWSRTQSLFPLESRFVVNLQEVISIVREFEENKEFALNRLLEKINHLHMDYSTYVNDANYKLELYSVGEIERYLFSTPFSEEYNLRYPEIQANLILQIYEQDGALMANDVEIYLKKKRTKSRILPAASVEKIRLNEVLGLLQRKGEGEDNESIVGMIWEACKFLSEFDHYPQTPRLQDFIENYSYKNSSRKYWKLRLATFYVTLCRWELLAYTDKYWWIRF